MKPTQTSQGDLAVHAAIGGAPTYGGGHQLPGGDSRSARWACDVHHDRIRCRMEDVCRRGQKEGSVTGWGLVMKIDISIPDDMQQEGVCLVWWIVGTIGFK